MSEPSACQHPVPEIFKERAKNPSVKLFILFKDHSFYLDILKCIVQSAVTTKELKSFRVNIFQIVTQPVNL